MKKIKYEEALSRLEGIVNHLENEDIELEDALSKFEEGIKLAKECNQQLNEADKKINILTTDLEGNIKSEPFKTTRERNEFLPDNNNRQNETGDAPF